VEVGPDLAAALRNKTRDLLLIDIMDPSREVDPRYRMYAVLTRDGRTLTGMLAADTGSSITLRREKQAEDLILRAEIEQIKATPNSVMPEGFEKHVSRQELADLVAYLLSTVGR
jgi:putative heme-binding domain-containing protein